MLQKYEALNRLHQAIIVAVIRGKNAEDAIGRCGQCPFERSRKWRLYTI